MVARPRRGDVYWVDFEPTRGHEQGGRHPAVVVQNDIGNRFSPITIVVPVTGRRPRREYPFHLWLPEGTLAKPGVVMCNHIARVEKSRLQGERLAALDEPTMRRLDDALRASLGLA